jgi:hypothetical protein
MIDIAMSRERERGEESKKKTGNTCVVVFAALYFFVSVNLKNFL